MRNRVGLLLTIGLLAVHMSVSAAVDYCAADAFGYGASAIGGGSATPVLVSSVSELSSALNKGKNKVIIITKNLTFTTCLKVQDGENVTLMALPGVTLTSLEQNKSNSGILYIKRFKNLIIRNLTFVGPGAYDCDGWDLLCFEGVTNAWVDHCDFQDGCDGNFDNKGNTDNVTISWCRFRYLKAPKSGGSGGSADHRFTNLLGSSSSDKPSDGTFNITWAYCWWDNGCKERMVRCRNCELHFLNCYWNSSVANYYVGPENAKCYFDGCTFEGKANSASKIFKSYGGTNACKFVDCSGNMPSNSGTISAPSYSYSSITFATAAAAKTAVTNASCGAGATLTVTNAGAVSSTCDAGTPPPTVYTVTWDATTNGGSCGTATTSVTDGNAIGSLPEATKENFTFDGWYTTPSGGTKITSATTVSDNITYYAQFTSTPVTTYYTVIWDANGGTCGTASTSVESGKAINTAIASLPTATKTGSTFDGWFTAISGGTKIADTQVISGNVTYYAHYTASGGGSGDCIEWTGTPNSLTGTSMTVGTNLQLTAGESASIDNAAVWSGSGNKTVFKIDGSAKYMEGHLIDNSDITSVTISAATNQNAAKNYALVFSPNAAFTTGLTVYTHSAPSASADKDETQLVHTFTASTGTKYFRLYRRFTYESTDYGDNQTIRVYGVKACSGSSTPANFVLSYDENGGSGTMASQEQTGASVTVVANTFTAPTGYAFKEWNTEMNGGGTDHAADDVITLTEDLTLYAIWEAQSYTVTLNTESGTGGTANVEATFDEAMPSIAVPTKDGYIFSGYFTEENGGGTQYYDENGSSTNSWAIAADTELHAHWVAGSNPISTGCNLHFWFFNADDATTNGKTNDATVFSGMVASGSNMSGSITIDGTSYSVTKRTGDNATFGSFTIPSGKTGVFYALAVSSGSGDRQINLVCGTNTYELPVAGGSDSYKRLESEELPAGTYSIEREGSSNVRMGIAVVKLCEALPASETPTISGQPAGNTYCAGDAIDELSVTATGSGTVTFQWKKDGVDISGAESDKYTPTESGTYACVVTNIEDSKSPTSVTSNDAVVTIKAAVVAPTISQTDNTVSFSTTTDGATIYYTTNNTDPTTSSASGTSVEITADCTVKAYAVKNGCSSTIESFAATYVVAKPEPEFTWTYDATMNAGGIYPVSVSTNGDANVTLSIVSAVTGVTGSFTAGKPATGTVSLGNYPEAETFTYRATSPETTNFAAKTEDKTVTIVRCVKSNIVSYANTYKSVSTSPKYYCEADGIGRIMKGKGSSSISISSSTYTGESWATKYCQSGDHSIQTYKESVFKIVLYVKSGSDATTMTTLKYSDSHIASDGDGTDILSTSQIIYNDNPSQTHITKNEFETVTIIPSTPMNKNGYLYFKFSSSVNLWGAKLYNAGGDEVTSVAFSGETTVEKFVSDAPFTKTAIQTTTPIKSGGTISYKSSDESVATVNANTGEVTILETGRTNITATLSGYGCFAAATASYSLVVKPCSDPACTISLTSGNAQKCASESVTLTATASSGATIQWYKDNVALSGKTGLTLTTTESGTFYATATANCVQKSNAITIANIAAPTATALHEYYYIKAGRVSPAIPLFKLTNVDVNDPATAFSMDHPAPTGCSYELHEDGIVYLVGIPDESLAADAYDLTVTAHNDCGYSDATATLNLRIQEKTTKPQIAWVADGTKNETLPGTVDAAKSTNHVLYQYLQTFFDLTPVNAYCTVDTNEIKDYYSRFDLVILTDYPDTQEVPSGDKDRKKSYSNALGCLIDEKPILSFEAFVAGCPNWGINSNPETPKPKQKDMTLLCSAHNIFAGTTIDVNDKITMLSSISGNGLQGFTGLEAPPGMLFIATIADPEGTKGNLIVCCERQKVIEARMMIMGLNYNDMGNVNADGKLIIKQIIEYLLQYKNLADCSLVFDNGVGNNTDPGFYTGTGTKGDGKWSTAANWYPAYNAVPKPLQAVRVDKPCNVDVTNAHCSSIRLRKDAGNGWNGSLTIQHDGSLTVTDYIKEVHGSNFMTTYPSAMEDLVLQASETGQNGSLVFGNEEDALQAKVEYYSLAEGAKTTTPVWQYVGIPVADRPIAIDAYHAAWMCSWESEGTVSSNWVWVENEDKIIPFKGYCITQVARKKYIHEGSLCMPTKQELPLRYFESVDGAGFNMFANSWVAPIDISKMTNEDFDGAEPTIFIYNTGTRAQYNVGGDPSTAGTNTGAGQFNAIPVNAASYLAGSLTKIPTMQGFFVQATREGKLTLDYNRICFNTTDYSTTAETMRAPRRAINEQAEEKPEPEVMRIDVNSSHWGDRVYILTHSDFSDAFDLGWDGSKQEGDEAAPMLAFVQDQNRLAVAAVESAEEQYLSFRAGEDSVYTFHFYYNGETIYLYDQLADQSEEIRTGNSYTFFATNQTPMPRFLITKNPPRIPTAVNSLESESLEFRGAQKMIIDGQLFILRDNRFYDARGVRVTHINRKEGAQ